MGAMSIERVDIGLLSGQQPSVMNNCFCVPCNGFSSGQRALSQEIPNLGLHGPGTALVATQVNPLYFWQGEKRIQ